MAAEEYKIFAAIRENNLKEVKRLIVENPALVNAIAPKKPLDTPGMSPLMVSLCTGRHKEIAEFLLENGADVNYRQDRKWGSEARPVLFDAVNSAVYNSRRYEWDGKPLPPLTLVWKHTKQDADETFYFLKRMIELGADVNQTDYYSRNALFEAISSMNMLCPSIDQRTGEYYPGKIMTDEMREDFRRIVMLLLESGADKNSTSTFTKKNIVNTFENEYIMKICGDLF